VVEEGPAAGRAVALASGPGSASLVGFAAMNAVGLELACGASAFAKKNYVIIFLGNKPSLKLTN
jgi:hypothetical protein